MKKSKKGFTLIELIAVLVILAIIALIVTPLVMSIVKKAKNSANKRSVDAYGKAIELAVATHLLDNGEYPTEINSLTIEYSGNEVVCNVKTLNEDGSIYLSECSVKGIDVKDTSTEDGWYHYGKTSSIEITTQAYNIGDVVTYNGMNFYVISDSDSNSDSVTLLKETPLTVDEVNMYGGVGTENNHVNMYISSITSQGSEAVNYIGKAWDTSGYGAMTYYGSSTCSGIFDNVQKTGCTNDYSKSDVKYVIDNWALDKLQAIDLVVDSTGYSARLITFDEFSEMCDTENEGTEISGFYTRYIPRYDWLYNNNYYYWTMTPNNDSWDGVEVVGSNGSRISFPVIYRSDHYGGDIGAVVRPVVTILKSAI